MSFPIGFTLLSQPFIEQDVPLTVSSNAIASGDLLDLAVGSVSWEDASSSTQHWQLKAVATETVTTAATTCKARMVSSITQLWVVESANNSDAAHNGDRMVLTDTNTVNNTGTDSTSQNACFIQTGTVGAAADKRIMGIIVPGTGVDPDAA
jgi:hypothetical protein